MFSVGISLATLEMRPALL